MRKIDSLNLDEVLEYYSNHSDIDTAIYFNICRNTFKKYLNENNIKRHSHSENLRLTEITSHGSHEEAQKLRKEAERVTKEKLYGDPNYNNHDQYVKTCNKKYNTNSVWEVTEISKKAKIKMNELYGSDYFVETKEFKEIVRKIFNEKYNVDYPFESSEFQEKLKEIFNEKFGSPSPFGNSEVRLKSDATKMVKYGTTNLNTVDSIRSKSCRRYIYKNEKFDSSWELAVWIYAEDHNEEIIHEPVKFEYIINNKSHFYIPDFIYQNKLIEIKGDHLMKNGKLNNPYKLNEDYLKLVNNAKDEIIKNNNIVIWNQEQIKPFIKYVKDTYGKDYLKSFKNK